MAVILYTGLMGSGKSYSAVENVLLQCFKEGRTVVTNMVLKKSEVYSEYQNANVITIPDEISYEDREHYFKSSNFPSGSVFVIDEAGELFPSGEKQTQVPQSLKQFFTKHRHSVGLDGKTSEIVLMTQDAGQLASWVRTLVDSQYDHIKLDKHGLKKTFRVDIYDGAHTGSNIPDKFLIKSATGTYKPEVFRFYKSHTNNTTNFESGLEEKVDDRAGFFHVYRNAFLAILSVPFLAWFAYSSLMSMFSDSQEHPIKEDNQFNQVREQPPIDTGLDPQIPSKSKKQSTKKTPEDLLIDQIKEEIPSYNPDPLLQLEHSEDFKLVGILKSGTRLKAMIRSTKGTYTISAYENCSFRRQIMEWVCVFDHKLVGYQTGPQFNDSGEPEDDGGPLQFAKLGS